MNKPIGWRTPDRALSQPDITIVFEDGMTWHETRGGSRHVEFYRLLPEGYTYFGESIDGLWACTSCGFLVEPIYAAEPQPPSGRFKLIVEALAKSDPVIKGDMKNWCLLCSADFPTWTYRRLQYLQEMTVLYPPRAADRIWSQWWDRGVQRLVYNRGGAEPPPPLMTSAYVDARGIHHTMP